MKPFQVKDSVLEIKGFEFSGLSAGLKPSKKKDLALAYADRPAKAAALFTRNSIVGAPIRVGREHILKSSNRVQALIVNSGNANVFTGDSGYKNCKSICRSLAKKLSIKKVEWIFPSSTGIIGQQIPYLKIIENMDALKADLGQGKKHIKNFAEAIRTTDKSAKYASTSLLLRGNREIRLLGIAKGAGMIEPNMATLLVYFFSDVQANASFLKQALKRACAKSFNAISVDSDTSTSDTALLLSSGSDDASISKNKSKSKSKSNTWLKNTSEKEYFCSALDALALNLAKKVVSDGEGCKRILELSLAGTKSYRENKRIAKVIINSPLVKTTLHGADPNIGRLIMALGKASKKIDEKEVSLHFLKHSFMHRGNNNIENLGLSIHYKSILNKNTLSTLRALFKKKEVFIHIKLNQKKDTQPAIVFGADLSKEYVDFNSRYSS